MNTEQCQFTKRLFTSMKGDFFHPDVSWICLHGLLWGAIFSFQRGISRSDIGAVLQASSSGHIVVTREKRGPVAAVVARFGSAPSPPST